MDLPNGIEIEDLAEWTTDEQAIYYIWHIAASAITKFGPDSKEFSDISQILLSEGESELMKKNARDGEAPMFGINLVEQREFILEDFLPTYRKATTMADQYNLARDEEYTSFIARCRTEVEADPRYSLK